MKGVDSLKSINVLKLFNELIKILYRVFIRIRLHYIFIITLKKVKKFQSNILVFRKKYYIFVLLLLCYSVYFSNEVKFRYKREKRIFRCK